MGFSTALNLAGPARRPRQMLGDQEYGGHSSIHDDAMAEKLGFRAGPIEGPTHFSQFQPLLAKIWGQAWFERGCISSHFLNMVVEGEEVRAFAEIPPEGATSTRVWAESRTARRSWRRARAWAPTPARRFWKPAWRPCARPAAC
ncbi:hypothetical protein [Phenylobacterium sp.]|uniref:hypothetical protein n=1 Tax=Phenylobacterium sp. TaxID=1871053 RepID=UPI002FC82C62